MFRPGVLRPADRARTNRLEGRSQQGSGVAISGKAELLEDMHAPPATLARLLAGTGYQGMAAHQARLADRRDVPEVTRPNLLKLVREAGARVSGDLILT